MLALALCSFLTAVEMPARCIYGDESRVRYSDVLEFGVTAEFARLQAAIAAAHIRAFKAEVEAVNGPELYDLWKTETYNRHRAWELLALALAHADPGEDGYDNNYMYAPMALGPCSSSAYVTGGDRTLFARLVIATALREQLGESAWEARQMPEPCPKYTNPR